jgi:hypothetical protein
LKGRDDDLGTQATCTAAITDATNRDTFAPSSNDAAIALETSPSPFGNRFKLINL